MGSASELKAPQNGNRNSVPLGLGLCVWSNELPRLRLTLGSLMFNGVFLFLFRVDGLWDNGPSSSVQKDSRLCKRGECLYRVCPCTSVVFSSALQCFHLYSVHMPCSFAVVLHPLHHYIHMVMFAVLIFLFVVFSTAIFWCFMSFFVVLWPFVAASLKCCLPFFWVSHVSHQIARGNFTSFEMAWTFCRPTVALGLFI